MKMRPLDRILLLVMVVLASYQVVVGIDHFTSLPIIAFTIAFGALIIAGLLMIILGFEVLDSPLVVIVSTVLPLSFSTGIIWQQWPALRLGYLVFAIVGFLAVIATHLIPMPGKLPTVVLVLVHSAAGIVIFLLPFLLAFRGVVKPGFALVGVGGLLISIGGLLLFFVKAGKPLLTRAKILKILPGMLLVMTACFVAGLGFS